MKIAVAVVLSVFLASLLVAEEKPMTNADVVALVQAGLGDDLVITKIRQTKTASFDTSTEGLVALKKQKVSDKIVEAMVLWTSAAVILVEIILLLGRRVDSLLHQRAGADKK